MKTITLNASVTASNERDADALRARMRACGTLLVNVMSSPGAGKTTLLSRLIRDLDGIRIAVMEADIESDVDAKRIEALGASSIQVHTSGMCHMDAGMTAAAFDELQQTLPCPQGIQLPSAQNLPCPQAIQLPSAQNLPCSQGRGTALKGGGGVCPNFDLIFLENVGNLICPAEYDTGAGLNLMLLSVPEGDDKPLKYPLMFQKSDALIVTKTDALRYFNFDLSKCEARARALNPNLKIFPVSAKTGEGMDKLETWLKQQMDEFR